MLDFYVRCIYFEKTKLLVDYDKGSLFALLFATADQKEGMSAFIEKRRAAFINK